jgi:hypothetical protein
MNATGSTVALALWLGLNAPAAWAQELAIPDAQQLQSMSIEEYEAYREQMRSRMEGAPAAAREPAPEPAAQEHEPAKKRNMDGGYGQGYGTRNGQSGMQGRQGGYGRGGGGRRR